MLETISELELTSELDAAIRDLLCRCFPPDVSIFSKSRHWHGSAPAYSVVDRSDDGRLKGHMAVVVRRIKAGARPALVAGIQNMAVSPEWRGQGVGDALMHAVMDEARRRGIPFGLLFCVPQLEKFYASLGWRRIDVDARMDFEGREAIPIPGKNIVMVRELAETPFPPGDLHLQGPDW
jgi:GNAT superfamily N-acetyltransferase